MLLLIVALVLGVLLFSRRIRLDNVSNVQGYVEEKPVTSVIRAYVDGKPVKSYLKK